MGESVCFRNNTIRCFVGSIAADLSSSQPTVLTEGMTQPPGHFLSFGLEGVFVMSVREMFEFWVYLC